MVSVFSIRIFSHTVRGGPKLFPRTPKRHPSDLVGAYLPSRRLSGTNVCNGPWQQPEVMRGVVNTLVIR